VQRRNSFVRHDTETSPDVSAKGPYYIAQRAFQRIGDNGTMGANRMSDAKAIEPI